MSVHASWSNNSQVRMNRHQILLTDVDLAKKNEWNRRRRLRLQQVRQQANDLASAVRVKVQTEKERNTLAERRRLSAEEKKWQERELRKLQTHYKACLTENGIAEENAKQQVNKEAIVQQHRELLGELTKTRCHIALEKQKAEEVIRNEKKEAADRCRELARNVENLRANLIASLPPPCCQSNSKPTSQPDKPREPNYDTVLSQRSGSNAPSKKSAKVSFRHKSPNKKKPPSSLEPQVIVVSPLNRKRTADRSPPKRSQYSFREKFDDTPMACSLKSYQCKYGRGKYSISDCEESNSEDSDDSNGTWPLYSPGRRHSPPRVQVYDHAGKQCYEYAQPSNTVTQIDPHEYEDVGTNTIIEEEKRHCNHKPDTAKRQIERGRTALSKERLRKEFDEMIRELSKLDRKERIQRVQQNPFPSRLCMTRERRKQREELRQVRLENAFKSYTAQEFEHTGESPGKYITTEPGSSNIAARVPPGCPLEGIGHLLQGRNEGRRPLVESENALKLLLERLRREKEELLLEQEKKKEGVGREVCQNLDKEEEDIEIPTWIHDVEKESSSSREAISIQKVRVDVEVSPVSKRKNSPGLSKKTSPTPPRKESPKANKKSPTKVGTSPKKTSPTQKSPKSGSPSKSPKSPKRKSVEKSPIVEEEKSPKLCSPTHNDDTSCGDVSLSDDSSCKSNNVSFEGIKVIVKVTDRPPETNGQELMTPHKRLSDAYTTSSGSSSYLSPPDRLNPTQREMLNSVLANIELKNKNPSLHQYITRLLAMSRESVDALSVSVSDVSLRSELITASNTPEKRTVATEAKILKATSSIGLQTTDSPRDHRFTDLAEMYSHRINALANMVDHFNAKSSKDIDETSYLSIPSQLDTSVRLSESIKKAAKTSFYPRPEDTFTSNYRGVQTEKYYSTTVNGNLVSPPRALNRDDVAALGLRMDILPKPDVLNQEPVNTVRQKVRPPASLQNIRRMPTVIPHELSTIIEADTPGTSGVQSNLPNRERLSPIPPSEESFHSMPSDIDSDLSSIPTLSPQRVTVTTTVEPGPSGWRGPNKKTVDMDESGNSSLSIISNMSDCLLSDRQRAREKSAPNSSSDDFEDIFQSLGIGWALATLRKTKEAKKLSLNSSSSSPKDQKKGEKSTSQSKGSSKYMHSTPVKKTVKSPVKSGKSSGQISSFGSEVSSVSGSKSCKNDSLSLTPPSLTLVTPYLSFNLHQGKTDDSNKK